VSISSSQQYQNINNHIFLLFYSIQKTHLSQLYISGNQQQTTPQKFSKQPLPKLIHRLFKNFRLQYHIKTNFKPSVSISFPQQYQNINNHIFLLFYSIQKTHLSQLYIPGHHQQTTPQQQERRKSSATNKTKQLRPSPHFLRTQHLSAIINRPSRRNLANNPCPR
jgi:hypothetical protein